MSSRPAPGWVLVLLLLGAGPQLLSAQSVEEARARLTRLEAAAAAAAKIAAREDSIRLARAAPDTHRIGTITVVAPKNLAPAAWAGAAGAWRELQARFGSQLTSLQGIHFLVLDRDWEGQLPQSGDPEERRLLMRAGVDSGSVARGLLALGAGHVSASRDREIAEWLRSIGDPTADAEPWLDSTFVELAIKPWRSVRRCHLGDVDGCRRALGLDPGVPLLDQWYDADDRRHLVERAVAPGRAGREECLRGGQDEACRSVLVESGAGEPALSASSRMALLNLTLRRGGAGAYDRLMESPDRPMAERLTRAAGLPLDTLLVEWRRLAMAARPTPVVLQAGSAWAAFGWIVIFAGLALGSSRWR